MLDLTATSHAWSLPSDIRETEPKLKVGINVYGVRGGTLPQRPGPPPNDSHRVRNATDARTTEVSRATEPRTSPRG